MAERFTIVGIGEALYDVFPDKQVLGGATLNVAVHAHQLAAPSGGRGVVVSRVGQDLLGQQLMEDLQRRGMTTQYVQTDPDRGTGKVYVGLDERGEPQFDIVRDAAWDMMQFDPDMEGLAQRCEAVVFGTLAQREGQSRTTICRCLDAARRAVRLFDVNLRQSFYDMRTITRSCELATVVKLNLRELGVVSNLLGLAPAAAPAPGSTPPAAKAGESVAPPAAWVDQQVQALLKRFKLKLVALTRGAQGTVLYTPTSRVEGEPVSYPANPGAGADAVGAGDACSAGLLVGLVQRWPLERTVRLANHVGAYVASQPGATPMLPEAILAMVR